MLEWPLYADRSRFGSVRWGSTTRVELLGVPGSLGVLNGDGPRFIMTVVPAESWTAIATYQIFRGDITVGAISELFVRPLKAGRSRRAKSILITH